MEEFFTRLNYKPPSKKFSGKFHHVESKNRRSVSDGIHERSEYPTAGRNIIMMKIVYVVYSAESNLVHPPQIFDNEHPAWVEARSRPVKTILRKDILGHAGNNFSTFIDFSDPASEPPLIPAGYKQIPTIVTIQK